MTNNTVPSFDNVVVLKDEQKKLGSFPRFPAVTGPGVPGKRQCSHERCMNRQGSLCLSKLVFPIFSLFFACPRSWADSILRRNVSPAQKREQKRLGPAWGETGRCWRRGRENQQKCHQQHCERRRKQLPGRKPQRRTALGKSIGALAAKEAACGQVSAAFRASMGTGKHGRAAR